MAVGDAGRSKSTDDVRSDLSAGLKSCTKLLASYREVFSHERRQSTKGWKR